MTCERLYLKFSFFRYIKGKLHLLNLPADRHQTTACPSETATSSNRSSTDEWRKKKLNHFTYSIFHIKNINMKCWHSPFHWRSGEGEWRDRRAGSGVRPPDPPANKQKNLLWLTELTWSPEPGEENSADQTEMWTINRSAGKQETMEEGEDHETPHRIDRSIDQSIIQTDV